jgi:osmoprotectant transport system permease protein
MMDQLADRIAELPRLLAGHMLLSVTALAVGIGISIPLGLAATRHPRLRGPLLNAAGLLQTVPSIALLALMVVVLGGRIGFMPAFVALTLYSMLPVLRNTVTGIQEVDPALTEAARGVGMTDRQSLLRVELPLAAPVIIAGVRIATVWVVGMATLSTPVGAPSLGNYIFLGLQTRNWIAVLFGCVFAVLLAVVLDQLIRLLEIATARRSSRLGWTAGVALGVLIVGGLLPVLSDFVRVTDGGTGTDAASPTTIEEDNAGLAGQTVVVGAKAFTEQYVLAELLRSTSASTTPGRSG